MIRRRLGHREREYSFTCSSLVVIKLFKICIGETCVNEAQLKELLNNRNNSQSANVVNNVGSPNTPTQPPPTVGGELGVGDPSSKGGGTEPAETSTPEESVSEPAPEPAPQEAPQQESNTGTGTETSPELAP